MKNAVHMGWTSASRVSDFAKTFPESNCQNMKLKYVFECKSYSCLNQIYCFLGARKNTTHLLNRFSDGYMFVRSCTEEMFVLVSVQGLIRFLKCCPVLAMCKGAAAAALVEHKSSLNVTKLNRCPTCHHPTHTTIEPQTHPPLYPFLFSSHLNTFSL